MKALIIITVIFISANLSAQKNSFALSGGYEIPNSRNLQGYNIGLEYSRDLKNNRWKIDYGLYAARHFWDRSGTLDLKPATDSSSFINEIENSTATSIRQDYIRLHIGGSYNVISRDKFRLGLGLEIIGNTRFLDSRSYKKNEVNFANSGFYHTTGKVLENHYDNHHLRTETFFASKIKIEYDVSSKLALMVQFRQFFEFIDFDVSQFNAGIVYKW